MPEQENWEHALTLSTKTNPMDKFTVRGSQFERPLYEFSGACAGCGEAPYMKLMSQLFGDRMFVTSATGCAYVVGSSTPSFPYVPMRRAMVLPTPTPCSRITPSMPWA